MVRIWWGPGSNLYSLWPHRPPPPLACNAAKLYRGGSGPRECPRNVVREMNRGMPEGHIISAKKRARARKIMNHESSDGVKIHRCFFHAHFVDKISGAQVFVDRRIHGYFRIYGRLRETVLPGVRNGHRTEQKRPAAEFLLGPMQMGV